MKNRYPHTSKFLVILTVLIFAGSNMVYGDIKAFNQAIKNGDYQAAAKETIDIWSDFNKDSKQTATIAREFGFVNYVAKDYDNAEMFASFLVDKGKNLSVPDSQPATSQVLLDLIRFSSKQGQKDHNNLVKSIKERLTVSGVDQISLLAAETLYRNDWAAGDWESTQESAGFAVEMYQRAGAGYLKEQREAEVISSAAGFLYKPVFKDYDNMVAVHNQIVADINQVADASIPAKLLEQKWISQAWVNTMEAYFHSNYSQMGTIIDSSLKYKELSELNDSVLAVEGEAELKPVCPGKVEVGTLSYPQLWAEKRLVGSVIVNLNFDENGQVSSSKVLAEVPPTLFAKSVTEAIPSFRWDVNPGVDKSSCRLSQNNYIHAIGFWGNCAATYARGDCPRATLESGSRSQNTGNVAPDL